MLKRIQNFCQERGHCSSSRNLEEKYHRIHSLIARVEKNCHRKDWLRKCVQGARRSKDTNQCSSNSRCPRNSFN